MFARQFATMVNSGLPILKALAILEDQTECKPLANVVNEVRLDVERGSSLSQAMAKHPKVFRNLFIAMIRAGETGGVLDSVLLRLADNLEREVELRQRVRSAMTYPIVVLAMVSLILVAMLLFIVPQFEGIYASLGGTLPLPTRILLTVSEVFRKYWWMWGLVDRWSSSSLQEVQGHDPGAGTTRRDQAEGAGVRLAVPQDRDVPVRLDAVDPAALRASRSCRHSTSCRRPWTTP